MSLVSSSSNHSSSSWPRIGQHHFAHLRAVAEGLSIQESALRYLGIDHGHQAITAHRQVVDRLRGLARRRGLSAWRLVGLTIRVGSGDVRPSLEDFIAERDLDGWTEAEVALLYEEAFPADARAERRRRLRDRQLALLKDLQSLAAEKPSPEDRLEGWFDPITTSRLAQAGLLLLRDLQQRIQGGGHWWRGLPAVGRVKAHRLAQYLNLLLPESEPLAPRPFHNPGAATALAPQDAGGALVQAGLFSGRPVTHGAPGTAVLTGARSDAEVIEAWVAARAGTAPTAKSYRREALRLLLWLTHERSKGFADVQVEDCLAYMSFLEHLPPAWISRRHSTVLGEGWAPFRGPLSVASRRQAVVVLGSFFGWMVNVGYLPSRNPWMLINRRTGDDAQQSMLDSRAFTPEAWSAMLLHLQAQPPDPSRARMLFILSFVEATGLRASELVGATMGALRQHRGRWVLQVHGKGARNRLVAVPGQAREALQDYLQDRGLGALGQQPPETPLLARLGDPAQAIGYQALYQTMKRWVREAILGSGLTPAEKDVALRASPHWLRHTFGTRALERRAPLEVVQRQLGHADPRTTMRYAHAQLERLQQEMDVAFGEDRPPQDDANP